jgi:hypothetical protein
LKRQRRFRAFRFLHPFRDRSVAAPLKLIRWRAGPVKLTRLVESRRERGKEDAQRNIIRVDDIPNKDGSWLQGLLGKIGNDVHYERTFPLPIRNMADDK